MTLGFRRNARDISRPAMMVQAALLTKVTLARDMSTTTSSLS
jgi:hypothetical protein